MPGYEHECPKCKTTKVYIRDIISCSKDEYCKDCGTKTNRIFGFSRTLEFQSYNDPMDGVEIRTKKQEKKQMKKHKQVDVRDTHMADKYKGETRKARRKPVYFT